ncbi:hypothetical protein DdX_19793 [Ditylenchus destructor]|uniref:Uncharacterized protein n=1 Tax=Ditylenchus destructor TaxID=166010 RepID=A0AAD4MIE2_9BILA|nr:hypothetical protein DdX_19793 [Ditylenchus destructor]
MKLTILFVFLGVMCVVDIVAGGTLKIEVREQAGVQGQFVSLPFPSKGTSPIKVSHKDIVNAFKTGPLANVVAGGKKVGDHFKSMYLKYSNKAQRGVSSPIGENFHEGMQSYLYNIAEVVVFMYERNAAAIEIDDSTVDY